MTAVPVMHERMTAAEFLALGERQDARRYELVDGEIVISEPTMLHNVVQVGLIVAIGTWIAEGESRGRVCVPLNVGLDDRNVFAPDVSWYSNTGVPDVHAPRPYPVPDLVVEIRSPSTWAYDIGAKRASYERHGLRELWLVDTAAEQVLVFRRSEPDSPAFDVALELSRGETLASPRLAGFALALDDLFQAS